MNDQLSQVSFGAAPAATIGAPEPAAARRRRPRRRLSRRLKRNVVGATFLAVTSAIMVVLLLLRPPHPATLILVGADYADNLAVPDNALGWNGLNEVAEVAEPGESRWLFSSWLRPTMTRQQKEPRRLVSADLWDKDWGKLGREKTVVLYFDLHGAVDHGAADDDRAYLLADYRDKKDDSLRRLSVKTIFDALEANPDLHNKNKLVIFDATKVAAHEPLAIHNDFVAELRHLDQTGRIPRDVVIISASDVNQVSWVSEELHKSIFAQKVIDGLRGAAAKNGPRITAADLYDYVADEVSQWVREDRDATQRPVLLPEADGRERAANMELVRLRGKPKPPPAMKDVAGPAFEPDKWLQDAWKDHDDLLKDSPPPYVAAPQLWSQYQAVLLRCESLARAGVPQESVKQALEGLRRQQGQLRDQLKDARHLRLSSRGNSLAMARAFGPLDGQPDEALLSQLWDLCKGPDGAEQRHKVAGEVREKVEKRAFYRWLVERVLNTNPEQVVASLTVAHDAALAVYRTDNERPTEALFLVMLASKGLPDSARKDGQRLLRALRLHRRAQEVALGLPDSEARSAEAQAGLSEKVAPYLRPLVAQADQSRRLAEDHLFAGSEDDLKQADRYFTAAEKDYGQAHKVAEAVRRAFWASAVVHANLPQYARWLTRSGSAEGKSAEQLWDKLHDLDEQLSKPALAEGGDTDLRKQADEVLANYDTLKQAFQRECADAMKGQGAALKSRRRRLEDLLAVPLVDNETGDGWKLRLAMIKDSRTTSHALLVEEISESARPAAQDAKEQEKGARKQAREAAERRGRMARYALGKRRFEEYYERNRAASALNWNEADHHLQDQDDWVTKFGRVGDQIARMTRETADGTAVNAAEKPEDVRRSLEQAELRCREVDGGLWRPGDADPVLRRRQLLTADLCRWLAERTLLDRWWCEGAQGKVPYYQYAGGLYLDDAVALLGNDKSEVTEAGGQEADKLRKVLGEGYAFGFKGSPIPAEGLAEITLHSQLEMRLPWPAGAPRGGGDAVGVPAAWLSAPKLPGGEIPRHGYPIRADQSEQALRLTVRNPEPLTLLAPDLGKDLGKRKAMSYEITWNGLFRGRQTDLAVPVNGSTPNMIVCQPPIPDVAGLGVTPDPKLFSDFEETPGILVVVLDLSGSMDRPAFKGRKKPSRFGAAKDALRKILGQRDLDGAFVSVMVFGIGPKAWHKRIETLREARPWKGSDDLSSVMGELDKLEPDGHTPLVRTMYESMKEFKKAADLAEKRDRKEFTGKKTLLVLTDGDDNCFEPRDFTTEDGRKGHWDGDELYKDGKKRIPEFLKDKFDRSGISINMIVFGDEEGEKKNARRQFKEVIEEKLQPGGNYFDEDIPNIDALTQRLLDGMRLHLGYQVWKADRFGDKRQRRPHNLDTLRDLEMLRSGHWNYYYYPSGQYELRTRLGLRQPQLVRLEPGELLLLRLTKDGFRRALVGELKEFRDKPHDRKDGWRLTALQYAEHVNDFSHTLLLGVEKELNPNERPDPTEPLGQVRPKEAWLEAYSADGAVLTGVQWAPDAGSAAPVWRVKVPPGVEWKELHGWVSGDIPARRPVFSDGKGLADPKEVRPASVGLSDQTVDLKVSVETLRAVDGWGKPVTCACLVVRGDFTKDKHIQAYLPPAHSGTVSGAEHHYETKGKDGHYTGVFWVIGADEKQMAERAAELRLMSLKEFKAGATELVLKAKDLDPHDPKQPSLTEFNRLADLRKEWPPSPEDTARREEDR